MSNSPSDDSNTIQFQMQSIVNGYPSQLDDAFLQALATAKQGGDATNDYFSGINQTSDFWGAIANNSIDFIDGVDPQGRPVVIASTGNVDLRVLAVYAGDPPAGADSNQDVTLGTVTVTTGNTTTQAAQMLALTARIATMPAYIPLSAELFQLLLKPLYSNVKTLLSNLSKNLQDASRVETPDIDPMEETEETLEEQDEVLEELPEELVEEGAEYLAINWSTVALDVACMAPLVAIPMIIEFLGHDMYHSLMIQNLTESDFNWSLDKSVSGKSAMLPADALIPGCQSRTNLMGNGETTRFSYQANFQFINSSNLGSIGYVLSVAPKEGGDRATLVFSIPWAGDNTIWVGTGASDSATTYAEHSAPNGNLTMSATFDSYQVTVTINKLSGKTEGDYFYSSLVVIEPLGG
jgi:hypothetical protein